MGSRIITGIQISGAPDGWVETYEVQYKTDISEPWQTIRDIDNTKPRLFNGNFISTIPSKSYFDLPIRTQLLRIIPKTWHLGIVMKLEVLGCFECNKYKYSYLLCAYIKYLIIFI